MPAATNACELALALDLPSAEAADAFVAPFDGLPLIYKVGLELFTAAGPTWVRSWVRRGRRIFLDLKFHDIPNTVGSAVARSQDLGVEFLTLHLLGGRRMVEAALKQSGSMRLLGVSVLTSFDEATWSEVLGATNASPLSRVDGPLPTPSQSAVGLVLAARRWGLDSVVCSAMELKELKRDWPQVYTVTPGIRFDGEAAHDQARVLSPGLARANGASVIVMGRSITAAADPRAAALRALGELGVSL